MWNFTLKNINYVISKDYAFITSYSSRGCKVELVAEVGKLSME